MNISEIRLCNPNSAFTERFLFVFKVVLGRNQGKVANKKVDCKLNVTRIAACRTIRGNVVYVRR